MAKLILMRHGQSLWNLHNLFTGWVDVPLSTVGIEEALSGGRKIESEPIDIIFTSTLSRATMTALLAMSVHSSGKVPIIIHDEEEKRRGWGAIHDPAVLSNIVPLFQAWELNERMYGKLQGMNKAEAAAQFGKEQVHIWRRSYDIAPPGGESLKMTAERTLPYFQGKVIPLMEEGKTIFIAAHGNSLRAILMFLDGLTADEVVSLEIPTGEPILYNHERGKFQKLT